MTPKAIGMKYSFNLQFFERIVDCFIHPAMDENKIQKKQARLFVLSHLLGPFIGNGTALAVYLSDPSTGFRVGIPVVAITGFWIFPVLLRLFGQLELLALISIQNLIFCVLWVTYFFGGATSPFLTWTLTVPLLAFFYVGDSRTMRLAILVLLSINAAAFYLICQIVDAPVHEMSVEAAEQLGLVSTIAIGIYVTMMALYYAKALASQVELETVMRHHMATASALRLAASQAEHASAAKVEFLAKMSHELRTPLNAIIGYSQMLLEEAEGEDADEIEDLERIQFSGQHLLRLVNGILDLARIDAGRMDLYIETYSIQELILEIESSVRSEAQARGNKLDFHIQPGLTTIAGDRVKTCNALSHVVHNAVKYTENGFIDVSIACEKTGWCSFVVRDTGIGISEEYLPTLFEQFAVNDDQTSTKYGGAGLGLALTRKLCRLMGGDVTVSTKVGEGSAFRLDLPQQPARSSSSKPAGQAFDQPAFST